MPAARPEIPLLDLDAAIIGQMLMALPIVARRAGHKTIRSTLGYGAPLPEFRGPENEFLRDVLQLNAIEVLDKWYGGKDGADQIERVMAEQVADMIHDNRKH